MQELCPAQKTAYEHLLKSVSVGNVCVVWSHDGMGRTTILKELHREKGGELLTLKDYIDDLRMQNPLQMEEALEQMLMRSINRNDLVILDDLSLIYDVICGCGFMSPYPRAKYIEAILTSIAAKICETEKCVVFSIDGVISKPIDSRCFNSSIKKYDLTDYRFLCEEYLGRNAKNLDFQKIFRFAPKLNAHQLKSACLWLKDEEDLDTAKFMDYMRSQRMGRNVDLEEVEAVDLTSLRGVDDVLEALEANIIVPLERDDLATEYDIQPKRGVLLAGPPGTGKTTIGRALAHRLKSKFFLVDGTFISGEREFYGKIKQVFDAAKNNAPAIIFIDDSDVIFENKEDFGLYRFLLTMLDGLEGESNKRICVMMTTMDVASVPPALIRSGRIELWLETRLPDEEARLAILNDNAHKLPHELRKYDTFKVAKDTDGLTGADLKRLFDDTKILLAYDRSRSMPAGDANEYFTKATEIIRSNKQKYADAEAKAKLRMPSMESALASAFRGSHFNPPDDDDDD